MSLPEYVVFVRAERRNGGMGANTLGLGACLAWSSDTEHHERAFVAVLCFEVILLCFD